MDTQTTIDQQMTSIAGMEIRNVVETFPETMRVFDEYGMDMCCGGEHTVKEAAWLHNLDSQALIGRLVEVIRLGKA